MINIRGEQSTILASAYPVNVAGELSGLVVLWRDITDRVRAEQTLRESEEQFRQLAESMPQLVWTARVDGVVDYYNRRAGLFQGIKQVADEQWTWGPVLHPDDVQATVEAWTLAVETGSVYQMEHRLCMADGSYRWHLSRGLPVRDESGKIVRWYGTATDIHDRKMSEELLRAYNERLERSNRDLQEFAFVASHDLQEPLRKIEALGDALLQKSDNLPERQQDYLARIRRAAGRMRAMVDGLLTLSRLNMEAQHFEPVDLNVLVAEVVAELGPVLRKSDGRVVAKRLPEVNGDRRQLRQLFFNLISNAIKFQAEGATPSITISTQRSTPKWVEIRVEDNGIGFDPAYTENLFQPFRRLVSMTQFEGAGMGLAVSRRIVERHGGWIEADSIPGRGSIFTVTFPLQSES
jgi:PAS domain S-box-containing protein